jgi:hypothetical protein
MPHIATLARLIPDVFRLEMADAKPFKIDGVYCRILPLTKGQFALVDADDYEWLNRRKWYALKASNSPGFYACSYETVALKTNICLLMHREILGLKRGDPRKGDHVKEWATLDNRRKNLRISTTSQNGMNRGKQSNNTSGFKGVSFSPRLNKYDTRIAFNNTQIYLALTDTAEEGARIYDEAARRLYGEYARLNFPNGELWLGDES